MWVQSCVCVCVHGKVLTLLWCPCEAGTYCTGLRSGAITGARSYFYTHTHPDTHTQPHPDTHTQIKKKKRDAMVAKKAMVHSITSESLKSISAPPPSSTSLLPPPLRRIVC